MANKDSTVLKGLPAAPCLCGRLHAEAIIFSNSGRSRSPAPQEVTARRPVTELLCAIISRAQCVSPGKLIIH